MKKNSIFNVLKVVYIYYKNNNVICDSGLTLGHTVVHAENVFKAGQMAVAISRVRDPSFLQIIGFKKEACLPHSHAIDIFYHRPLHSVLEDATCCRNVIGGEYY